MGEYLSPREALEAIQRVVVYLEEIERLGRPTRCQNVSAIDTLNQVHATFAKLCLMSIDKIVSRLYELNEVLALIETDGEK